MKRGGGVVLGGKIAPIFFNTMEDAGALPIEVDVSEMNMGDVIDVYPYKGKVRNHETGELIASFELKTDVLLDEMRAGGRILLIISCGLTTTAQRWACRTAMYSASLSRLQPAAKASRWRKKWLAAPVALPVFAWANTANLR
ncbi:MAG: hypothetical protein G5701_00225 [Serratia symbiotica]|nr:hypothetical protein [Serratia symbiotica]